MRPPAPTLVRETTLAALIQRSPQLRAVPPVDVHRTTVSGLTHDSRAVRPGDLFAALPGVTAHGADHAVEAVARGAVAILTDEAGVSRAGTHVPVLQAASPAAVVGPLSALVCGDPSASLPVVAVTGTDGKTTTTCLIAAALEALGVPTGRIGSLDTWLNGRALLHDEPQHRRTTPEAPDLQATLALLLDQGAGAVTLEASSHGLVQGRLAGTQVAVGVFTNLGHEHLDFHGVPEAYFAAKASLFDSAMTERSVVNVDDGYGRRLAAALLAAGRDVVTVSASGRAEAHWRGSDIRLGKDATSFVATGPQGRVPVRIQLTGRFNVDNALAALGALTALGESPDPAAGALGALDEVPGRMQWLSAPPQNGTPDGNPRPLGLIDYAHTPSALNAVLSTVRQVVGGRPRVLLVFGTGGGRDMSKRRALGQEAARGADVVVLTDDNPRHEDPREILAALQSGVADVGAGTASYVVRDRDEAIQLAVRLAEPGDVVLVAGKGPDRVQLVGDRVVPVDDERSLRRALATRSRIGLDPPPT